jgi:predicted short-subunit dehydrogenase-like oxidoreductase (DUF2520 family)
MKVAIVGAGKVGRALYGALKRTRHEPRLIPGRRAVRTRFDDALLMLCVRDSAIARVAQELASSGHIGKTTAVVHVAGAFGPELLSPLAGRCAGVGQAHPMLSFASPRFAPALRGAHLLIEGDPKAVDRAARIGRALGMTPRSWKHLDRALYHAAGGLVANGSAALAAAGARLLELAGAPAGEGAQVLAPLLRSVAENLERLGLPAALTGPIRRGDAATVSAHRRGIAARAPELLPIYVALAQLQLELAREIGEASASELDAVARQIGSSSVSARVSARRR